MLLLAMIVLIVVSVLVVQAQRHERHLSRLPVRIHINGIRGKSSVTRLIAAGLRAGGVRTVAKTTGTTPRFIYPDGSEVPVVRAGSANIIEQVRIVRRAARLEVEALVVECMAVKPELQSVVEERIIRSTHSVITNVRPDHLEEMGPTVLDVARNLARTIAPEAPLFTAERAHLAVLCEVAASRSATVNVALPEALDPDLLARFPYIEHAENVALALAVVEALGVDRDTALDGMIRSTPDPGAMRLSRSEHAGRPVVFVNAFAANDPDSCVLAWERLQELLPHDRRTLGLAVCRADRPDRSRQIGEVMATQLPLDLCVAAGAETAPLTRAFRHARRAGSGGPTLYDMEGKTPEEVYHLVLEHASTIPLVVYGIGNIVGFGEQLAEVFYRQALDSPHTAPDLQTSEVQLV